MKQLSEELKFNGYTYKLIKRNDFKALYEQHSKRSGLIAYELFYIPKHNGFNIGETTINPTEYFPKDEYFGKFAWTLKVDLEYALQRYEQLPKINLLKS